LSTGKNLTQCLAKDFLNGYAKIEVINGQAGMSIQPDLNIHTQVYNKHPIVDSFKTALKSAMVDQSGNFHPQHFELKNAMMQGIDSDLIDLDTLLTPDEMLKCSSLDIIWS